MRLRYWPWPSSVAVLPLTLLLFAASISQAAVGWVTLSSFADPRTGTGVEGASASMIKGKLYVSHGHRGSDSNYLSMYDVATDTWTHLSPSLPDAAVLRSEMAGGMVAGRHFAFGGRGAPGFADLEIFNPTSGTWTNGAPMPTARGGLGGATWAGHIYAVGGRTNFGFGDGAPLAVNEDYDATVGVWSSRASMPVAVSDCYACVGYNGKVYVFGGATSKVTVTNVTQIYDIASGTWTIGAPMPTPRGAALAGVLCDGGTTYIAVFGGFDGYTNLGVTELYNPATDTWSGAPPMPVISSEMAQGPTWDLTSIYAVGSGMFGPSYGTVFALRTNASCFVTGMTVAEFTGKAAEGSVRLSWTPAGALSGERVDVLRARTISGPYSVVGSGLLVSATQASMSFEDPGVEPETRYFYRLSVAGEPGRVLAGPLSVFTPAAILRLAVLPNPTTGMARAQYVLPRAGRISMDLYSVDGVKLRTLVSAEAAAGSGSVPLQLTGLPAGLYYLRLNSPIGSCRTHLVLFR